VILIAAVIATAIGLVNLLAIGLCCAAAKPAPLAEQAGYERIELNRAA
jgi:hypothetical protein